MTQKYTCEFYLFTINIKQKNSKISLYNKKLSDYVSD